MEESLSMRRSNRERDNDYEEDADFLNEIFEDEED
jgi:hypothetical protein